MLEQVLREPQRLKLMQQNAMIDFIKCFEHIGIHSIGLFPAICDFTVYFIKQERLVTVELPKKIIQKRQIT